MRIRTKLVSYFLIVLLVPLSMLVFVLVRNSQDILTDQMIGNLTISADDRATHIEQFLKSSTEVIKIIAETEAISEKFAEYDATPSRALRDMLIGELPDPRKSVDGIDEISLIDNSGTVVASTNLNNIGARMDREPFFIDGKNTGGIFFNDRSGVIKISTVIPVIYRGKAIGLARGVINNDYFQNIVQEKFRLGSTGEALLAVMGPDRNPQFIARRIFENQAISSLDSSIPTRTALSGQNMVLTGVKDYRGVKVIAVTRYLEDLKAGLVVKIDQSELDDILRSVFTVAGIISLFGILLAVIVSWLLAKNFSDPILELSEDTKKISKENLQIPISAKLLGAHDEIGALSLNFKSMMDSLSQAYAETKQLISGANAMIVGVDLAGNVTVFNEAAEKITGYKRDEVMGRNWFEIVMPHARYPKAYSLFEEFKIDGKPIPEDFQGPILNKKGEERMIEWRSSVLRHDGKPAGIISYGIDITDRRKAEAALEKSEARFRHSMDNMLEGCMILGFDWTYLYVNEVAAEHGQNKPENLIGRTILEMYPGVEKSGVFAHYKKCMDERVGQHFEEAYTFADGTQRWYEFSVSPVQEGIFVLSLDITDRKKAEEQYRIVVETANEAVISVDASRKINFVNPRMVRMFGYSSENEMIGRNLDELIAPEDMESHRKQMQDRSEGKSSIYDRRFLRKNGEIFWCAVSASPILNNKKQFIGAFALLTDITERKKLEQEGVSRNRALRMLSETNKSLIHATDEMMLLNTVCNIAVNSGGYHMAWVGFIENDKNKTIRPVASAGFESGYLESLDLTWADTERGRGPSGVAARTRTIDMSHDIANDPRMAPWREDALKRGYRSSIALPLTSGGSFLGIITIYSSEKDAFLPAEIKILSEMADDLAFGMISLRTRAQHRVAEAEREQYFKFFKLSTDIMVIADPQGCFKQVNPTCLSVLGYSEDELLSKPFLDFIHPEDRKSTEEEMARQMKIGYSLNFENRYICKDGSVIWLSWRANYDKNDGITYATARDITERKLAEEAARAASQYMRSLIEASLDPLVTISPAGKITDVNVATEKVTGYPREKLIGTDFSDYFVDPKKASEGYQQVFREGIVRDYPLEIRHKDGTQTPVLYNATVYKDKDGKVTGVFAAARDITERRKSEARIRDLSELRSKFLDIIAHQLRTPLSAVNWNLEMLLGGDFGKLDKAQEKFLNATYLESKKITNRIRDILTAVDIEDNRVLIKNEDVAIESLVSSIVGEAKERCALKGLKLNYEFPDGDLPRVNGDGEKLRIVISQFIDNAVTYTKEGGTISVKLSQKDGKARFEVKDSGIGIPAAEQHRIYERFHRASNATLMHPDGFGLGLYVAKYLIRQHGGEMGFSSEENKGSTFWFEIPVKSA